jgi:chromosome segregation protein
VADDGIAEKCIRYLRQGHLGIATFLPLNKIKSRPIPQNIEDFLTIPGVHGLAINLIKFSNKFADVFSHVFGSTLVVEDIEVARKIGIGRIRMVTLEGDVIETSGSMRGGYRRQRSIGLSFADSQTSNLAEVDIIDQTEKIEKVKQELAKIENK